MDVQVSFLSFLIGRKIAHTTFFGVSQKFRSFVCTAANMRIQLRRISPPEHSGFIAEFRTNDDGRLPGGPALKDDEFIVGTYEWMFFVGDYFASKGNFLSGVPFLDEVPLRFGLDDPDERYHVPLLVSPWSYSTYRGS